MAFTRYVYREHERFSLATQNTDEGVIPETSDCVFYAVFSAIETQLILFIIHLFCVLRNKNFYCVIYFLIKTESSSHKLVTTSVK